MNDKILNLILIQMLFYLSLISSIRSNELIRRNNSSSLRNLEQFYGEATLSFSSSGPKIIANVNNVTRDKLSFFLKKGDTSILIDDSLLSIGSFISTDYKNSKGKIYNVTKISYNLINSDDKIVVKLKEELTSFSGLFAFSEASEIILENFNTDYLKTTEFMFLDCKSLKKIEISDFDVSHVNDMYGMFFGCINLIDIDVSKWITTSANDMRYIFYGCESLTQIDVSNWDTSSASDIRYIFQDCKKLTYIDVSKWKMSSMKYISCMFKGCSELSQLDVSNWDISNVQYMSYLFDGCYNLKEIDVSKWKTTKVTTMAYMFRSCSNLNDLDISKWDTSIVTNMEYMFCNCENLNNLDVSKWDTKSVTNMAYMFNSCSILNNLDVSKWVTSNVKNMAYMFCNCENLNNLDFSKWDTKSVTNMAYMFCNCENLNNLDFSSWVTSSVTNMEYMFYNCENLNNLNFSKWVTSSVTNMEYMFYNCTSLNQLYLNNWDVKGVTTMSHMFSNCDTLSELDVSDWDTSNIKNMEYMFNNCKILTNLKVTNWDISGVTNMFGIFQNCKKLDKLDVSNWSMPNVIKLYAMFQNCKTLPILNISYWDTESELSLNSIFYGCSGIKPPSGYFVNNNGYEKCSDNCIECKENFDNCLSCKNGNFPTNGNCEIKEIKNNNCYLTCNTCSALGNSKNHYCIECADNYIKDPAIPGNCVRKCNNYYYIFENNLYCTETAECNENFNLEVPDEKKCVNNCENENKKQYNAQCLDECPENTIFDEICKDNNIDQCFQSIRKINLTYEEVIQKKSQNLMVQNYFYEFNYTNNHVSIYENEDYRVIIFKNGDCLEILNINTSRIDISECLNKLGLVNPIFIITEKFKDKYSISFSIYNSEELAEIILEEQCAGTNYTIIKSAQNFIMDPQCLYWMVVEKLDVFNIKSKLYTDICYFAESISKKDMSLNDRIKHCFPNYSICEDNCYNEISNIETLELTCVCSVGKKYTKELVSMIDENGFFTDTNLPFLKCPQTFYNNIYINPAFFIFGAFFFNGIISLLIYFIRKNEPINVYIKELEVQIIEYQNKNKKNEKRKKNKNNDKEKNKINEKENKAKKTKKKLGEQNRKEGDEKKKLAKIQDKNMKEVKGKSKERKNNNQNAPPKKLGKKDVVIFDKKEEEQKEKIKIPKNKNKINKIQLKKINDLGSDNKLSIMSELISSNDIYRVNKKNYMKDSSETNEIKSNNLENKNNNKNINIKVNNKNINNKYNGNNDKLNEKNTKYKKNKCCSSCTKQNVKISLEDILNDESFEEMDYWEAVEADKRSLCEMYIAKLVETHQISNLFIENKLLGNLPRLFLTSLSFDLCFYINGLYYSEDYISERYQSEEEETFLNIVYRSIVRIFIVSIISWIIDCFNQFFLPSEDDLNKNVKRLVEDGDNEFNLETYRKKQQKYIKSFFIIGLVLKIFSLYHMVCVFHHYKYSVTDWITSSLISFIIFNGGSMLITFFTVLIRYISLKCKSPKLYCVAAN